MEKKDQWFKLLIGWGRGCQQHRKDQKQDGYSYLFVDTEPDDVTFMLAGHRSWSVLKIVWPPNRSVGRVTSKSTPIMARRRLQFVDIPTGRGIRVNFLSRNTNVEMEDCPISSVQKWYFATSTKIATIIHHNNNFNSQCLYIFFSVLQTVLRVIMLYLTNWCTRVGW